MLTRTLTIAQLTLIQKEIGGLCTELIQLRHQLASKQQYAERLEVLLRQRLERIDNLNGKLEQARESNKRLKGEGKRLAVMVETPRPSMLRAWVTNLRALAPQSQGSDYSPPSRSPG